MGPKSNPRRLRYDGGLGGEEQYEWLDRTERGKEI